MPKGKKSADPDLGRRLIKQHMAKTRQRYRNIGILDDGSDSDDHDEVRALPATSIIEETDLTAVLQKATIALQNFESNDKIKIFTDDKPNNSDLTTFIAEHRHMLSIPRKPTWNPEMTKKELQRLEEESLWQWRRSLSVLESKENACLTPYEKNLEFWRELWRVLERCDVLVQIVDARNPLLYYSNDLNNYFLDIAKEKGLQRSCLLLLNKSDLLTSKQRAYWSQYFQNQNIQVAFWSAKAALEVELKEEIEDEEAEKKSEDKVEESTANHNSSKVLSRDELLDLLKSLCVSTTSGGRKSVGLTGYPNVGKSATLNALIQTKKSAVSATPGRTKHMQTFNIDEELTLCDSPGLVMPSFAYSQADLVAAGILSIEQMRDCVSPIKLICQQFPRWYLAQRYSLMMPDVKEGEDPNRHATAEEFLSSYAFLHGYLTDNGNPHLHRVARIVLKQYANGELLYRHPPPAVDGEDYESADLTLTKSNNVANGDVAVNKKDSSTKGTGLNDFDEKFFQKVNEPQGVVKKKQPGFGILSSAPQPGMRMGKPKQLKQKEKLRRRFAHLDKHEYEQ